MNRARLGTGLVLAGLIGGAAWWLGWVPPQPDRMLHAIPRDALVVSAHRDLAGRQDALLANPMVEALAGLLGGEEVDLAALAKDSGVQATLRRFCSDELIAAFVPQMGPLAMDTVVLSSWLGGRSHWLRWVMLLGGTDMRIERQPGGRVYWITETDLQDSQGRTIRLSLTFEEGLALGCLSVDPHNIRMVIGCYDRNLPSVLSTEPRLVDWLMQSEQPDRGWVRPPRWYPFRYAITEASPDRFAVTARVEGDWTAATPASPLRVPPLVGSLPFVSLTASRGLLETAAWDEGVTDVVDLLNRLGAEGVALSALDGEYGGRLRGIRVPALLLAAPCEDAAAATARIYRLVHHLGPRVGLDLVVEPGPGENPRIFAVGTAQESFYGGLPESERAAFCVSDGWLLAASSRNALERLLERREWAPAGPEPQGADRDALRLSADLGRGQKPLRNVLAVYSLAQLLSGGGSSSASDWLAQARSATEAMGGLGRLDVQAHPSDNELRVTLEVGP